MSAPPAGFEPALPPPEGGALSPELRGPGETIYQREGPQPTRFYPRRVARRRRQRIDVAIAGAIGLLLLAGWRVRDLRAVLARSRTIDIAVSSA